MDKLKSLIDWIISIYSKWKLVVLGIIIIGSTSLGYFVFGPFINSDVYKWFNKQAANSSLISGLIDVQGMLADKIVASTIPLFTVWSLVLAAYCLDKSQIKLINESSKYLAFFTGSTALIVFGLGSVLFGICLYGLSYFGYSHGFLAASIFALLVIICGFFIRASTRPELKENSALNKLAGKMLVVCMLLGFSAYIYGLVKDPLMYWSVINQAYELDMANK